MCLSWDKSVMLRAVKWKWCANHNYSLRGSVHSSLKSVEGQESKRGEKKEVVVETEVPTCVC